MKYERTWHFCQHTVLDFACFIIIFLCMFKEEQKENSFIARSINKQNQPEVVCLRV